MQAQHYLSCQLQKEVFSSTPQGYLRGVNPHHCTLPTDSLLTLHYLCGWKPRILHFKIQLEPYELGIQSASKSGEWYQIQMLGTRRKWSPPALKQLGWGPHIHHGQNGHKRWKHLRWSPFLWQKRKWGREPTLLDILFLGRMSKSKSMMKATPFSEQQGPIFTTENTADSIFQESLLLETFFIF